MARVPPASVAPSPKPRAPARFGLALAACAAACCFCGVAPAQQAASLSRATELFKNRQYNDCIKVLQADVRDRPEAECGRQFLLLGECHYLTGQYETARPYFSRAVRFLGESREKMSAEFRLACSQFRIGDHPGALGSIESFLARYPTDPLGGQLLVFKMLIVAQRGKEAEAEVAAIHKKIQEGIQKYSHATGMEADQILCDFYLKTGQGDKVLDVYSRIVQNFRSVIAGLQAGNQPVPRAFETSHDNAALQLGALYVERKQPAEAARWLENVRYDPDMKRKARLLLAKAAFERRDFNAVVTYLTEPGFLEGVPAGPQRSDMFLLLGLAERARPDGNPGRVEECLKQVGPEVKGYVQAQAALADIYREKGLEEPAIKAYHNVEGSPEHAAAALYWLGTIHMGQADRSQDPAVAMPLYRKASDMFARLFTLYPLSPFVKQAREKTDILAGKGVDVSFARGDEENVKAWEQTARDKKGRIEGAQALMSLMRLHAASVVDGKTGRALKAPDYAQCAAACDRLLDEKVYAGDGFDPQNWKSLLAEILYHRGLCETASLQGAREQKPGEPAPVRVRGATAAAAIGWFTRARGLADPKQLDLVKGIELGLLEAMFKSDRAEDRAQAEQRFQQLEADYGNDDRFQRLALDLAEWYEGQSRLAEAARQFAGVADRGKNMAEDDRLRLHYAAGALYSRAAVQAQQAKDRGTYAIYIYPKEVIALDDDVRKTYPPLRKTVDMQWPGGGKGVSAGDAVAALSKASQIPFVWMPDKGTDTLAGWMETRRLDLANGRCTVAQALDLILDPQNHRLAFDIGLTGAAPTIEPPTVDAEDPEAERWMKVVEIYDLRQADGRYKPLSRHYGAWESVHAGRKSVLLFTVLERIEKVGETRVVWADGVEKQDKLAAEYTQFPGIAAGSDPRCSRVLASVLPPLELKHRIIRRDASADLYEAAKEQYNRIRQIHPKSRHGERSLFALALNYYNQQDYEKMKVVLREYLKLFDNPSHEFYRQACFWVGWAFENEKRYREACDYYARAAEERLVVLRPGRDAKPVSFDELKGGLSDDTQFALAEPVSGEFRDSSLQAVVDFMRVNAHTDIRLDPSAQGVTNTVTLAAFRGEPAYGVLCGALGLLGLTFRAENVEREIAEKAYFRMASSYKKDNLMGQALESCQALLARYPETVRRRDAQKLMLDIHRGLKDYGKAMATLQELQRTAVDGEEKYRLEYEIAAMYFDMADYAKAAAKFREILGAARATSDRLAIRDAYAKALFRGGDVAEAAAQFETLTREEPDPLRSYVDNLMAFYCRFAAGKAEEQQFPEDAALFIQTYEKLGEAERGRLTPSQFATATWIYYTQALIDLKKARVGAAMEKLNAITTSPDDFLAADAAYQLGMLHMERKDYEKAREMFEYLLFSTRSAESAVRATFALGRCFQALGMEDKARERFAQVVERYPLSPCAGMIRAGAATQAVDRAAQPQPGEGKP